MVPAYSPWLATPKFQVVGGLYAVGLCGVGCGPDSLGIGMGMRGHRVWFYVAICFSVLTVLDLISIAVESFIREMLDSVRCKIVNTVLSAFLAFCDRPVYGYYLREPNAFHISPLSDQRAGAVVMWVIGSLIFLMPAIVLTFRLLQPRERHLI